MFSGIVAALGRVTRVVAHGGDLTLSVEAESGFSNHLSCGSSVLLAGVCLTVVELGKRSFTVDISAETLACTTLGCLREGDRVNLENALRLGGAIDGHLVSGHVDAVVRVTKRVPDKRSERFEIEKPVSLGRLIAPRGAVCLDGVSLTVNDLSTGGFGVNVVPYTLRHTTFAFRQAGDAVNLEVDLIARYVASSLARNS